MNKLMTTFFLTILVLSFKNSFAISSVDYDNQFPNTVLPYFINNTKEGYLIGTNKHRLYYREKSDEQKRRCLVILPGRSEPIMKYAEVFYDLDHAFKDRGAEHHIFLMDHRGQGRSSREGITLQVGHVNDFDEYVNDLRVFVEKIVKPSRCYGVSLVAHSMGAGIALRYLDFYPDTFDRFVLSSPMLKIQTKPYPYLAARTIVQANVLRGKGREYAPGQGDHNSNAKFEDNRFTTSPERFRMAQNIYEWFQDTKLGGTSNKWILEVMKGTNEIRKDYRKVNSPLRVFTAGTELYSELEEMQKLCEKAMDCELTDFPTAKHEIFMDRDENRNLALKLTLNTLLK